MSAEAEPRDCLPPRSLYIHVPFCRSKCSYCDFYSLPGSCTEVGGLVEATLRRTRELAARFGAEGFDTVYIGGGTPSILPRAELRRLLEGVAELAPSPAEWTIEANPESFDEDFLGVIRDSGVSRLSLGIQSLDDDLLKILGRPADSRTALRALELAAATGLRVSTDCIAGLPRRGGLRGEVGRLLDAGVGHLSVYDLVLEEGTPLAARAARGELELLDEDQAAEERAAMEELLGAACFRRYEISNYAPPGAESLHNCAYWHLDSYLGAGPGAVSTLRLRDGSALRLSESRSLEDYLVGRAAAEAEEETLSLRDAAFEALMMATRTIFGLDRGDFQRRFGPSPEALFGSSLAPWEAHLVTGLPWPGSSEAHESASQGCIALDSQGLDLQGRFLVECLAELEENFDEALRPRPPRNSACLARG